MNNIKTFKNEQFGEIRTVEINNEPWFVGKDVAEALGYANPRKAIGDHVDNEDKIQGDGVTIRDTIGREQNPVCINESGLYSLVLSSKLPTAKQFKRWVTSDVLPSIRKHGVYAVDELLNNPEFAIKAFTALKEEREKNKTLQADNEKMKPKALFADAVAGSQTSILIGDLAKMLRQNGVEIGQNRLFEWMRSNGYLVKQKGSSYNMPTQRSMERGWFEIKESAIAHSDGHISINKTAKLTGKGQVYFVGLFMKKEEEKKNQTNV